MGDFTLPNIMNKDFYTFQYGDKHGIRLTRPQLFNNRIKWKYVGVLHEYAESLEPTKSSELLSGNYYFTLGHEGSRSKDPEKYHKDAIILENAFKEAYEKGDEIYNRYAFYTAQSYRDCNMTEKALEYYKKVLTLENWSEEKYISCLEIYTIYENMKQEELGLHYLVESFKYNNERVECIYRLIKYYCARGMNKVAYAYYTLIKDYYEEEYINAKSFNFLFMKKGEYDFYLPYYMIIVSEKLKKYDTFSKMYEIIFQQKFLYAGTWFINCLFYNIQFGIHKFPKTNEFLNSMITYVNSYSKDIENRKYIKNVLSYYKNELNMDCGNIE
jgi:tetratricopeptide (TPR) repeat protein